ncbi:MAG: BspA family leucine-rich repeat surface protein [Bacilli bacterium]
MKKRVVIVLIIVILVLIGFLYQTFAMSNTITEENDTYVVNVSDNTSIELPARTSKKVYYKLTNTNNGVVRYGIGYSGTNVEAKVYEDSVDSETGLIDYMENKFIKLKLINNGITSSTITLSTVLGYENGGDLIVPSGVTLVKNKVKLVNTLKNAESSVSATSNFLDTSLVRNTIETLTISNDNLVSVDALGSFDVSKNNDGTVMLWYTKGTGDNLYNVYIGAEGGKVYAPMGTYRYFSYLTNTVSMNFTYFDTSNTTYMGEMFKKSESVVNLDLSMFDTSKVTVMEQLFNGCTKLTSVDLSSFNTSRVSYMNYMFNGCSSLKGINLSSFDTSNVKDMKYMFANCTSLKSLDLSSFNTSKITSMYHMFFDCNSLENIDLSNFDTSNVTSMNGMFVKCYALKELDLSNFNTSKATDMLNMFQYCTSLTKLNISSFDTSNVTNMNSMFSYNSKLTYIDMRNMTFGSNLLYANSMFYTVPNNATIYVKSNTEKTWLNTNYSSLTNVIAVS